MLPSQINVGGKTYKIKEKNTLKQGGTEYNGLCFLEHQEIHVKKKFPEESSKTKVFLHEVIHAINHHFNLLHDDHDKEEEVTTIIANGLNMVLKDNPELVEYLHKVYCT